MDFRAFFMKTLSESLKVCVQDKKIIILSLAPLLLGFILYVFLGFWIYDTLFQWIQQTY